MRTIRSPQRSPCYRCRERADVAVARGHDVWYSCWDHAEELLEHGGVLVGGELV
jgi:hypothetical protein